jgi:hypothetical protein
MKRFFYFVFGFQSITSLIDAQEFALASNQSQVISFTSIQKDGNDLALDYSKFNPLTASLAFDSSTNQLVAIPMNESKLTVVDGSTNQISTFDLSNVVMISPCDEGTYFTRMTSLDGKVYALNNQGSDLVEFDITSKKAKNLGSVTFPTDEKLSIFGGDLIANSNGNLVLISVNGSVFEINLASRNASLLGKISGIPSDYTINGVSVNSDGTIRLANAQGKGRYTVSLDNLKAVYQGNDVPTYDLASDVKIEESLNELILFPNEVTNGILNVKNLKNTNEVTLVIYDLFSNQVFSKKQILNDTQQIASFNVNLKPSIYLAKVINKNGKELIAKKIIFK